MQRREAAKRGQMYMQGNYSGGFSGNRASPSMEPTVQSVGEQRPAYTRLVMCSQRPYIVPWPNNNL